MVFNGFFTILKLFQISYSPVALDKQSLSKTTQDTSPVATSNVGETEVTRDTFFPHISPNLIDLFNFFFIFIYFTLKGTLLFLFYFRDNRLSVGHGLSFNKFVGIACDEG